jgi:hypothetical protein
METKPTECQVARYLRAGYTHWIAYERNIGSEQDPFFVSGGFPTTGDAVGIHLRNHQAKSLALKELYEAS